jgi:hypothetical protein
VKSGKQSADAILDTSLTSQAYISQFAFTLNLHSYMEESERIALWPGDAFVWRRYSPSAALGTPVLCAVSDRPLRQGGLSLARTPPRVQASSQLL